MPKKLTTAEFVRRSKLVHGDRYDYTETGYLGGRTKVTIGCKIHGPFNQTPERHLLGHGCRYCNECPKNTTQQFISDCKAIHGDRYDYSESVYINCRKPVQIHCPIHGNFFQRPDAHLHQKQGCPKCKSDKMRKSTSDFIQQAKKVHGDLYDYSRVRYVDGHTSVCIKCKVHGTFRQTPRNHVTGSGCPKCVGKISKLERLFLDEVGIPEDRRQVPISGTKYQVDGIDGSTVYEFLGDYWHGNPRTTDSNRPMCSSSTTTFGDLLSRTDRKFKRLKSLGYSVKYVWESDWNDWKRSLDEKISIREYNNRVEW